MTSEPTIQAERDPERRRGRRVATILWWVAAALALVALGIEYSDTHRVRWPQALMAFTFLVIAASNHFRKR